MKNLIVLSAILFFAVSFTSCVKKSQSEDELINLTGTWLGEGYQCPTGTLHNETIDITHNLTTGEVVATKVTGDACVTVGNITFTGNFDGIFEPSHSENLFDVTFVTGSQDMPNSFFSESTIEIVNSNLMTDTALEGIVFTRE